MEGKFYFINSFLEVDESSGEAAKAILKRCGNYFTSKELAESALKEVSRIIYKYSRQNEC